ncbi:MAG: UDP-N-acetylglucosamine 1-carboxyvinyltransferase [Clostridia bacterium]|nr:UDP-N-acetylglucosamine 1-carboxyvinyltransferase [Clostridia bacterium]
MDKIIINGGNPLHGTVEISGMKNAALPIIYACVLVEDKCVIENIPNVRDVELSLNILRKMGATIKTLGKNTVEIDCTHINQGTSDPELVKKIRASYYLLGSELGRFGKAKVAYPGGCDFGGRPIDQHIRGFESLGGTVCTDSGCIEIDADEGVCGAHIYFDIVSVGATINAMLAAALADGNTVIENAAREPHIVDLANFLNTCGARISGAGTDVIRVKGVNSLHGCTYAIIPDMIEAGTYMVAAAATGGCVKLTNVIPKHLESVSAKLEEAGAVVDEFDDSVIVTGKVKVRKANVKTHPYPGFPTDMQPQMAVLLCLADGVSYVSEGVYEKRFRYVEELIKMGASIKVDGRTAVIEGGKPLHGAPVIAVDLRAGVAMAIAGLVAEGTTEISDIHLIERGYDDIVGKFKMLGADIKKVSLPDPEELPLKKVNLA